MSADNWGICPKCKRDRFRKRESAIAAVKIFYGKIPAEEYEEKMDRAKAIEDGPLKQTLREDHELGTNEDGAFYVRYYCSCRTCGLKFEFKEDKQIY